MLLKAETFLIKDLIAITAKGNDTARIAAAYLLGELRANEATDVLLDNIGLTYTPPFGRMPKYGYVPCSVALMKIGGSTLGASTVVTKIIERIKGEEKDQVLDYLSYTLFLIAGDESRDILKKTLIGEKNPATIERVKKSLSNISKYEAGESRTPQKK